MHLDGSTSGWMDVRCLIVSCGAVYYFVMLCYVMFVCLFVCFVCFACFACLLVCLFVFGRGVNGMRAHSLP